MLLTSNQYKQANHSLACFTLVVLLEMMIELSLRTESNLTALLVTM